MYANIRLLIADDHQVVRDGIRALLETVADIDVIEEAADGVEVVKKTRLLNPDVILLDLAMPRRTGLEAIEDILAENPDVRILVLSSYSNDEKVLAAIRAGAMGYLLKEATAQELIQAIRDVYQGESSLHPTVGRKLIHELNRPPTLPPVEQHLTNRELDVLRLVGGGFSNQEIANQLVITEHTVRTHLSNIFTKLHCNNRTEAALYALNKGLTSL